MFSSTSRLPFKLFPYSTFNVFIIIQIFNLNLFLSSFLFFQCLSDLMINQNISGWSYMEKLVLEGHWSQRSWFPWFLQGHLFYFSVVDVDDPAYVFSYFKKFNKFRRMLFCSKPDKIQKTGFWLLHHFHLFLLINVKNLSMVSLYIFHTILLNFYVNQ